MRIVRDGIPFILPPSLLAVILLAFGYWYVALLFIVIAGFMAYFFRDPERVLPSEPNVIVAPADGRVTRVEALAAGSDDSPTLISIFLSPLDVHINRAPIAGRITDVSYTKGKFLMATDKSASQVNEQNSLTIEGDRITIVCKQIAGILARRIVCWKRNGEQVKRGERFGLIKFGSRTDVVLPGSVEVLVTEGMRVLGGSTIIGRMR